MEALHGGEMIEGKAKHGRSKRTRTSGRRANSNRGAGLDYQDGDSPASSKKFEHVGFNVELLGEVIRDVRKLRGQTRKQLAEASNISESYLGLIETGAKTAGKDRNASFLVLNRIAECLSIPTCWLLLLAEQGGQKSEQGQKIDGAICEIKNKIKLHIFLESENIDDISKLIL